MSTRRTVLFALVVILVLFVAASVTHPTGKESHVDPSGPRVALGAATSSTWYCAEGTSSPGGRADEEIVLGNVGSSPTHARITVFAGGDVVPVHRDVVVTAGAVSRVHVADIAAVPEPGVLVEVRGGTTAVEHRIRRGDDVALGPCAREPDAESHFAAGTTAKGAELWLALFNPFPDDAIVDVRGLTGDGVRAPGGLQGVVVPRFSRVSLAVHDLIPRVDLVATEVTVRRGRAVAEEALTLDGTDGRRGLALSLGERASRQWWFPTGLVGTGHQEQLVVANGSDRPASVTVSFTLDAAAAIEPQTVVVPGTSALAVDLSRVPVQIGFSIAMRADRAVVAEMLGANTAPLAAPVRGIATDLGVVAGASQWVIVPARTESGSTDVLAVVATDRKSHRLTLVQRSGGRERIVARTTVPANGRAAFDLGALVANPNVALLVRSDGPVAVERSSTTPGFTRSHGVPAIG